MPDGDQPITFFFADTGEGTRLWEHDLPIAAPTLRQYETILRTAIADGGGHVFKTVGDTVCAQFPNPYGAVTAATIAKRAIHDAIWPSGAPLCIRIALHSGRAIERGGDFFGPPVNQVSRLLHAGHAGQTLLSDAVHAEIGDALPGEIVCRDLGRHTLRDVQEPIRIYQLDIAGQTQEFPPLATLEYDPHNLPAQMTSFIGRETELAELRALLTREDVRLLTLTGPAGVGKTRLALHLAEESRGPFPDGRFLVQLAAVSDPSLVARTTADTLGIREPDDDALLSAITAFLREKELLLLLDNFEQVSAAAPVVSQLLGACPPLRILVTSRIRLRLSGEQEFEVPPLTMPAHAGVPVAEMERIDAVRLFVSRARATRPQFSLTAANASSLAGICQRLDGLPLAIELAAARSKRIPPEQMLNQLGDRLGFLNQGSRDLPPRQQALQAAIDWSFDLLSPEHQTLFQRLGIFVGGFTLEAAEEVLNPPHSIESAASFYDVLDGISTLVDNSLLQAVTAPNGDPRYLMLETIHEYARQRLAGAGELTRLSQRHAAWALRLGRESRAHWRATDECDWLARLDLEQDNLRAALDWLDEQGPVEEHLELVAALWWFWINRGYLPEGRKQLERALQRRSDERSPARADALTGAATIAHLRGDWSAADDLFTQALPLMRVLDDNRGLVRALNNAGNVALVRDDLARAAALYDEALDRLRVSEDKTVLGIVLSNLGRIARHRGDYETARGRFAEAIVVQDEIGERRGKITTTANLADLVYDIEQTDEAEALFREVRDGYAELEDQHSIAYALERLAQIAIIHGDWTAAQAHIDRALAIFDEVGDEDGTASMWVAFAGLRLAQGNPKEAAQLLIQALTIWRTREVDTTLVPTLVKLAAAANALDKPERAARLLGAVAKLREGVEAALSPRDQREIGQVTTASRDLLSEPAFATAFAAGRALPRDAIFTEARRAAE